MIARYLAILSIPISCALSTLIVSGCSKSEPPLPKTIPAARDEAVKLRDAALEARKSRNPKAAVAAAKRAKTVAGVAAKLFAGPTTRPGDDRALAEASDAARKASLVADLTAEEARLAEMCGSWKARGYRTGRGLAVRAVFVSLAFAAGKAADANTADMPAQLREAAELAAGLADYLTDRGALPDGARDWAGIAKDMNALAKKPSPGVGVLMAVGLLLAGQNRMALYEIEAIDSNCVVSSVDRTAYHFLRGVTYSMNGLPRLGVEQVEFSVVAAGEDPNTIGPEWLGAVHLFLAAECLSRREFREADLQLARSMQVWPDNPACVFLTGERLTADGRYEQAAESLEKHAAGTSEQWLARRLAARARHVRDNKAEAKPLFSDTGFLCDVMIHCVGEKAERKAPQQLKSVIAAARSLAQRILDQLGGTAGDRAGDAAQ